MDDRCNDCEHKLHCLLEENLCEATENYLKEAQENTFHEYDEVDYYDKYDEPWGDMNEDDEGSIETV